MVSEKIVLWLINQLSLKISLSFLTNGYLSSIGSCKCLKKIKNKRISVSETRVNLLLKCLVRISFRCIIYFQQFEKKQPILLYAWVSHLKIENPELGSRGRQALGRVQGQRPAGESERQRPSDAEDFSISETNLRGSP